MFNSAHIAVINVKRRKKSEKESERDREGKTQQDTQKKYTEYEMHRKKITLNTENIYVYIEKKNGSTLPTHLLAHI